MNVPATITGAIAVDRLDALDRLADRCHASREQIVARALEEFVARENQLAELLDAADDQIERGEYLTQNEMERWFAGRIRARA